MKGEFEVAVEIERLPLSRASAEALRHLERYDAIVLTSKHAETLLKKELRRAREAQLQVIRVGPRKELLKFHLQGKRVLFPRSMLAPFDIIRRLRANGVTIRAIPLYIPKVAPLSRADRKRLFDATVQLYFKSPSGIHGLLRQCRGRSRAAILSIPARCIGATTAQAARNAGFKRVFIR